VSRRGLLAVGLLVSGACASALREPQPVAAIGGAGVAMVAAAEVDRLLQEGEAAYARRPEVAAVARARELFLAAARADEGRVEGLCGAMRTGAWLVEHEADAAVRDVLATESVELGQWCGRRAPDEPECEYRLALALGQQAREHPATAHDGLARMVALLERAADAAPALDDSGPDRVLALVLLRAPSWPTGPGDPELGLEHAGRAVARVGEAPANQLVLGEALAANGRGTEARAAFARALELALEAARSGDPDASEWRRDAEAWLARPL
jgi:hypothetical protein